MHSSTFGLLADVNTRDPNLLTEGHRALLEALREPIA